MRESPKAIAAFHEYCLLGPSRSLAKLAKLSEHFGMASVTVRHLEQWSSAHHWVERAMKYDAEQAIEREQKNKEALDEMNKRHAVMGQLNAMRAVKQIEALIEAKSFGSYASVQLLKNATDLERLARGAPTERTEQTGLDGAPLIPVHIYIPDNGRDGYGKQEDDAG